MHLVNALASGVNGAANGSAMLLQRGTSTAVTYYLDFEASQPTTGTLTLDANGGAVVYVNQLVDVKVLDVNGVQLREFVAGDEAPAVEVISQSFTGTSYTDGSSGASKPTTLQTVLDAAYTSFGALNWNVLSGSQTLTVQSALGLSTSMVFNVKAYGAFGNGVANDAPAITAAIAAASATGGIVFFPPGTYRITSSITLSGGTVSLWGCGAQSTKIALDNPAASQALQCNAAFVATAFVSGIWFGAINQSTTAPLVTVTGVGTRVTFLDCFFGGDTLTNGQHIAVSATGTSAMVIIDRCQFQQRANLACVSNPGVARVLIRGSEFNVTTTGTYSANVLNLTDGVNVSDCYFTASGVTAGAPVYIGFAPSAWASCVFTGNRFQAGSAVTVTALKNTAGVPQFDCVEIGNTFGDPTFGLTNIIPYAYTTDGYNTNTIGGHFSRMLVNKDGAISTNANIAVSAKATETVAILRSGAGAQVISTTEKGRIGDRFTVQISNNSGGVVAPTFGGLLTTRTGYVANVANGQLRVVQFMWLQDLLGSVNGIWLQSAVET